MVPVAPLIGLQFAPRRVAALPLVGEAGRAPVQVPSVGAQRLADERVAR